MYNVQACNIDKHVGTLTCLTKAIVTVHTDTSTNTTRPVLAHLPLSLDCIWVLKIKVLAETHER